MTISIRDVNNDFNLVRMERSQALNRTGRIQANEREIARLESEISIRKDNINITKDLITSNNETINILKQIKANNEILLSTHKEQRGLMVESRDLTKESRDLTKESRDLTKESRDANDKVVKAYDELLDIAKDSCDLTQKELELTGKMISTTEKMIAIMEKNPAKYGELSSSDVQKQPEVIEAKNQVTELVGGKIKEYPKETRPALTETTKKVIEATFTEINPTDTKATRELFRNLGTRIEVELDKKYEALSVKEFRKLVDANYKSVENFFRIKRLDYLDLALKDIKA